MLYLWCKAFHIIFVITWMAGLFYLPRLFIYHAAATDQVSRDRFVIMERKLFRIIMRPSQVLAFVFGIALLVQNWSAFYNQGWLWLKLLLVVGLAIYHEYCGALMRRLESGSPVMSDRALRIFNELPVLCLFPIVIFVVLKPF